MTIFDKTPYDALWGIVKHLAPELPIYPEAMDEDEDSTPQSYLIIRTGISNGTGVFGDGISQIRRSDCDLILVSKGKATRADDLHNINREKIRAALDAAERPYNGYNLGYDDGIKSSEYTFSTTIFYKI